MAKVQNYIRYEFDVNYRLRCAKVAECEFQQNYNKRLDK